MYIEKEDFIKWITKELGAKKTSKQNEYVSNCPFCDKKENHFDFTINVDKMVMNCWRGFDPRCESGHNVLTLISFYYDISFDRAKDFIKEKFENENSLQRLRKKLKNIESDRILHVDVEKIVWDIPRDSVEIMSAETNGAKRALKWLKKIRKVHIDLIREINPMHLSETVAGRWKKYSDRVFFPVSSGRNRAWIAYSMDKNSTKERPKTMNPPGSILSNMLFMYDFCQGAKIILVCEGIFDALRLFMFGFSAVAIFGVNISDSQLELLNELGADELVVCLDPDANVMKENRKGRKSSKSFKLARELDEFFLGDVSIMKLRREDPDRSSYREVTFCYESREMLGRGRKRFKTLHNVGK